MMRQPDTHDARRTREAEFWRRVRALDRHVLGCRGANGVRQLRWFLCLGLTLALAALLVLWARPLLDAATENPGNHTGRQVMVTAILLKLLAATLLAVCVLTRFWGLAALNMGLVTACVIVTTMGGFGLTAPTPASPPADTVEGTEVTP